MSQNYFEWANEQLKRRLFPPSGIPQVSQEQRQEMKEIYEKFYKGKKFDYLGNPIENGEESD